MGKKKMTKAEMQKAAQLLLSQAQEKLDQAAEIAEAGGFNISFRGGGTYVPSAAFDINSEEVRAKAIEQIKRYCAGQDMDSWTKEEWDERIEDWSRDILMELRYYEYADSPGWWQPSRNC